MLAVAQASMAALLKIMMYQDDISFILLFIVSLCWLTSFAGASLFEIITQCLARLRLLCRFSRVCRYRDMALCAEA